MSTKIAGITPYYIDSTQRSDNKLEYTKAMQNSVCDVFLEPFNLEKNITRADAFNLGVEKAITKGYEIIGLFDVDIKLPIDALNDTIKLLKSNSADIVYPYSGMPLETNPNISSKFKPYSIDKNLLAFLFNDNVDFELPYVFETKELLGLAVCMRTETFLEVGKENPNFIGWGFEDHERAARYETLDKQITRLPYQITHMSHDQSIRKHHLWKHNYWEMVKVTSMNKKELQEYIKTW